MYSFARPVFGSALFLIRTFFLLALAGSANTGSAATLIGNCQNIPNGELGNLNFLHYLLIAIVSALAGLVSVHTIFALIWRSVLSMRESIPQSVLKIEIHP
jgi:Na+/H+ antiporter NhaD/arsenite permease-like protein